MGKMGGFSAGDMKKLQQQLLELQKTNEDFLEKCAKELAARLLAKVIKRTEPGDYSKEIEVVAKRNSKYHKKGDTYKKKINPSGKMGGTLRRGWIAKTHEEAEAGSGKPGAAEAAQYANSLPIKREGDLFVVEIVNPVEYASYVEYGHRTAGHKGWVPGKHMLTISEREIQAIAPGVLEARLRKVLEGCVK